MKKRFAIKKNREFQSIINSKNSKANRTFVVYKMPNDLAFNKYGISVGKKLGNAVTRNKVKRQVRHILREMNLKSKQGNNVIIIVKKNVLKITFERMSLDLKHAFKISNIK